MREFKLVLDKETDNKLRWNSEVGVSEIPFELYVPKWRVPRPIPTVVHVAIDPGCKTGGSGPPKTSARGEFTSDEIKLRESIVINVRFVSEHTETVRYRPVGDAEDWEVGEPYIPKTLLPLPYPESVTLRIRWGEPWDDLKHAKNTG